MSIIGMDADINTCHNFREKLIKHNVLDKLFAAYTEMGGKLIHSIGFERAKLQMGLKAYMYNLRRLSMLKHNVFKHSG